MGDRTSDQAPAVPPVPPEPSVASRVRTVLARGAGGTVEAGMLRRPLRSARVRDDGVVVLVVDVGGMSRGGREGAGGAMPGGTATVEIVDAVCTGRCRTRGARPSFALDGRAPHPTPTSCAPDCAVTRGIVRISGVVSASASARGRRLVSADGGGVRAEHEPGTLRLSELRPLEVSYLTTDGVHVVPRGALASAAVDPVGVDEEAWLRRLGADGGALAAGLALRAGRQIAGASPRLVGVDGSGIDIAVGTENAVFSDVVRVPFGQVCTTPDEVERELERLTGPF